MTSLNHLQVCGAQSQLQAHVPPLGGDVDSHPVHQLQVCGDRVQPTDAMVPGDGSVPSEVGGSSGGHCNSEPIG